MTVEATHNRYRQAGSPHEPVKTAYAMGSIIPRLKTTAREAGPAFLAGVTTRVGLFELMQQSLEQDMLEPVQVGLMFFGISAMTTAVSTTVQEMQHMQKLGLKGYHDYHAQVIPQTPDTPIIHAIKEVTYGRTAEAEAVVAAYDIAGRQQRYAETKKQLARRTSAESRFYYYRNQALAELTEKVKPGKEASITNTKIDAVMLRNIRKEIAETVLFHQLTDTDIMQSNDMIRQLQATAQQLGRTDEISQKAIFKTVQNEQTDILWNALTGIHREKFYKSFIRFPLGIIAGEILRKPLLTAVEKSHEALLWLQDLPESETVKTIQAGFSQFTKGISTWWQTEAKPRVIPGLFKGFKNRLVNPHYSVIPPSLDTAIDSQTPTPTSTPTPAPTSTPSPTATATQEIMLPTPAPEIPTINLLDSSTHAQFISHNTLNTTPNNFPMTVEPYPFQNIVPFDDTNYTPEPGQIVAHGALEITGTPGERVAMWLCTYPEDTSIDLKHLRTIIVFEPVGSTDLPPLTDEYPTLLMGHSYGYDKKVGLDTVWQYEVFEPYRRFVDPNLPQETWHPPTEDIQFTISKGDTDITYRAVRTMIIDETQITVPQLLEKIKE